MTEEENKAIELIGWLNLNRSYIITSKQSNKQDVHKAIDIILNFIEKLQKENEELKRNSISKKRVEKFLEVIKPQAMPKDIPDDLEIDEEELLSRMYNSGAVGALETILDRNNDAYKKGKQYGKEF